MSFLTGITNLTNWMDNVIMPALAALFFALGIPVICGFADPSSGLGVVLRHPLAFLVGEPRMWHLKPPPAATPR